MHFAVGMGAAGAAACVGCVVMRRGWRWVPAAMTAGGLWALIPDLPRIFREDIPNAPLAGLLGSETLEAGLERWGNLFFFHHILDAQPKEFALAGLAAMLLLYNAGLMMLMTLEHRQRHSLANRVWRAHGVKGLLPGQARDVDKHIADPPPQTDSTLIEHDEKSDVIYKIDPQRIKRAE